ncbi:MAG TPA: hypothetical protein VMM77_02965 [Gemmatimonadaceae bacterium]|nr:hypothetical protein [Gemmatimonadaceae bacterium]
MTNRDEIVDTALDPVHGPYTPASGATTALRLLALLFMGLGGAALALAIGVDFVSDPETASQTFGFLQTVAAVVGLSGIFWGVDLWSPEGTRALRDWRSALRRVTALHVVTTAFVIAEVWLVMLAIREFLIESPAFYSTLARLTFAGFLAHHFLPLRRRLAFFAALSLVGVYAVFGFADAAWLAGVGLCLIVICHLPVPFWWRVGVLLAAGALLAAARADLVTAPWSARVWPILGSMFMFRLILYMYDLRHSKEPMGAARTVSYFFLLPNLTFPLFPVVDFATFRKTYYDRDALLIYQQGVQWMIRGIIHLLLYRWVYHYLVITPSDITNGFDLARYVGANFLLYLRVSGQFHLIVGLLHLFGFRLPETHRFFFLAPSFTEFWRRINIYWKDFMMKVVYYPAYFRLRKSGAIKGAETAALIIATLLVFAATWFLHAYQWFWILGTFLLSWTDVAFWAILAGLLVANTLVELRHGRSRTLHAPKWSARMLIKRTVLTAGTFVMIASLWALWTSETFEGYRALWQNAGVMRDSAAAKQLAIVLAGVLVASLVFTFVFRKRVSTAGGIGAPNALNFPFFRDAVLSLAPLLLIFGLAEPSVNKRFSIALQEVVHHVRIGELNQRDESLLQQGYYENLVGANRFSSQLWEVYATRPSKRAWPSIMITEVMRHSDSFASPELRPNFSFLYHGEPLSTNRWGMRDKEYEQTPAPGSVRLAVMGQSYVMGESVADGETFESILEDRLNIDLNPLTGARYEVLNFAVSWQHPTIQLLLLESKVLSFRPNAALFVGHLRDPVNTSAHLARRVAAGDTLPYDFLREIVSKAGITRDMDRSEAAARMRPYEFEVLSRTYQRIAEICREQGIVPYYVYLVNPKDGNKSETVDSLVAMAAEAGLQVLNLVDVYDGHDEATLQVAPWDRHPNPRAHRLIADRLYLDLSESDFLTSGLTPDTTER